MTITATAPLAGSYRVDADHSSIAFAVRHMGISTFRGSFAGVQGSVAAEPGAALAIAGAVPVEGISVVSPAELRAHLLGPDFFDAGRHPVVAFASDAVDLRADGTAVVDGHLTIRNVSRAVHAMGTWTAPVEDPFGATRSALTLEATIDRRDYGMTWNMPLPKGGDALGSAVTLTVQLELVRE